jgi:hypothetical protein
MLKFLKQFKSFNHYSFLKTIIEMDYETRNPEHGGIPKLNFKTKLKRMRKSYFYFLKRYKMTKFFLTWSIYFNICLLIWFIFFIYQINN